MANLVFDFLHNYVTGERRASDPADAYQFDEGHVLEAVVPVAVTSCEIQYWIRGMEKADAYTPTSITHNTDNTYTILGNIPNSYFENSGDLRVYIVVTDGDASITTYEGYIHIKERQMPEDYVDDDPDNDAVQIIAAARGYAETSEAWAVGQINGEDVPSTADQYQNNASYYANQAASAASSAAAQASLAPAYDNTATYAVGDYCLHDGRLYECTTAITTAEAWTAAHWTAVTVGGELSNLKEDISESASLQENLYAKREITVSAKRNQVFYFPLFSGDTITVTNAGSNGFSIFTQNTKGTSSGDIVETISNWLAQNKSVTFTATENTLYIRAYCTGVTTIKVGLTNGIIENIEKYVNNEKQGIKTLKAETASLTGYAGLTLRVYNSKQNNTAVTYFEIDDNFAGVQFGRGFTKPYASGFCWLTPTRLQIFRYTTERVEIANVEHGLTLKDYVQITIRSTNKNKGVFMIATGGGGYYTVEVAYEGCDSTLQVNPINCTINNVQLFFTDSDKKNKIWFFGDSYVDLYPPYLIDLGYSNFALDGFSGRNSAEAFSSLNHSIGYQPKPDKLIWALGMNDPDDGAINASWLENVGKVIDTCNANGIELILCTVPNTPTRDNSYKNSYIYTSGIRFCDIATSVEPNGSATWYTGLITADNVHPSEAGRKVIAQRVIRDIPELLSRV